MADKKISAMTAATTLGGTEKIPAVQGGANVYLTPAQLAVYGSPSIENRLINGDFLIDQTNEGAVYNVSSSIKVMDMWRTSNAGGFSTQPTHSIQRSSDAPAGFSNSVIITSLAAQTPSAAQYGIFYQRVEGTMLADLNWGTANAKNVVVSFWAKSSLTGTFYGSIFAAATRSYVFPYTIAVAGTWQYFVISIPGDQSGTYPTDNTNSLSVLFGLGAGANFQTTPSTWTAGSYWSGTGETKLLATSGATLQLTNVRMRAGAVDLPYAPRPYGTELSLCQRYFAKTIPQGTAVAQAAGSTGALTVKNPIASGAPSVYWSYPVTMRATPSVTTYNPSQSNGNWRNLTAGSDATLSLDPGTTIGQGGVLVAASGTVTSIGDILAIHATADARL